MRNFVVFLISCLALIGMASARPNCGNNVWRDDCNNPSLEVSGDVHSVTFGSPMSITAIGGTFDSIVYIRGSGSAQNLPPVEVSVLSAGRVILDFNANIGNVASVEAQSGDVPAYLVQPLDFNGDAVADSTDVLLLQNAADLYAQTPAEPEYYDGPWEDVA